MREGEKLVNIARIRPDIDNGKICLPGTLGRAFLAMYVVLMASSRERSYRNRRPAAGKHARQVAAGMES